jgi:hypothetical protein
MYPRLAFASNLTLFLLIAFPPNMLSNISRYSRKISSLLAAALPLDARKKG